MTFFPLTADFPQVGEERREIIESLIANFPFFDSTASPMYLSVLELWNSMRNDFSSCPLDSLGEVVRIENEVVFMNRTMKDCGDEEFGYWIIYKQNNLP